MLQLVPGSLAQSTRVACTMAWVEFLGSEARRRTSIESRQEDVIEFILSLIEKGLTKVTIAGKLADIAFMGKLFWGYAQSAGELGSRMLEG